MLAKGRVAGREGKGFVNQRIVGKNAADTHTAGRQAGWLEPELSHRLSMLWGKARQAIQILLLPL